MYTPKGDVKNKRPAPPLLICISAHGVVGTKCIGAKESQTGSDQLRFAQWRPDWNSTSAKQKPNSEWLKFVVTSKAKAQD